MLPHFVDERLVLSEVCWQIGQVNKKCRNKRSIPFPIGIGHYSHLSSSDAQNIERSMVNMTLHSFHGRFPFDGSGYVKNNLALGPVYLHFPTMENYWENCEDDFEVRRRDYMWFTVQQIIDYKMEWDVTCITEDGLDLIDPYFFEHIQLLELPHINWSLP